MFSDIDLSYRSLTFFSNKLIDQLDFRDKYMRLAEVIPWHKLSEKVKDCYSDIGRPSLSPRLMMGLEIVKNFENLSDERTLELYRTNPYIQYFCGEVEFQNKVPCTPSSLSTFRSKTADFLPQEIFQISVQLHSYEAMEEDVIIDTTCQEKNITFPTDVKLLSKVIIRCRKLATECDVKLNNTFKNEVKEILRTIRFEKGKDKTEEVRKARKRLITIAGILVREIERKMSEDQRTANNDDLTLYKKVVDQSKPEKKMTAAEKTNEIKELQNIVNTCIEYAKMYGVQIRQIEKYEEKTENQISQYNNAKGRGREKGYADCKRGLEKTANYFIRKLEEKLTDSQLSEIEDDINSFKEKLKKKPKERRIYSLHEPNVICITKGKAGKKHEYGSKASIAITKTSGVIVGAVNFQENRHDSDTVQATVEHIVETRSVKPKNVYCDRGYRGAQEKNQDINVFIPSAPTSSTTDEEKTEAIKNFGRRSSIEPVIGHIKNDFRLAKTHLKGAIGDKVNLLLACAAYNFKKYWNKIIQRQKIQIQEG